MPMLVLRYMCIIVLTNRLANNSADMFNSHLVYVINSDWSTCLIVIWSTCSIVIGLRAQ